MIKTEPLLAWIQKLAALVLLSFTILVYEKIFGGRETRGSRAMLEFFHFTFAWLRYSQISNSVHGYFKIC